MDTNPTNLSQVDSDLNTIVSGFFAVDHLGPDAYEAVRQRVRNNPDAYLDAFEAKFLGSKFDAMAHSDLQLAAFLRLLVDERPERVRLLAGQLTRQYDAVLVVYDSVTDKKALGKLLPEDRMRLSNRLNRQRAKMRELAG